MMLFVLGPHRSGTSVVTLALKTMGFELGGPLIAANSGNETGYWEHQKALALNNLVLTSVDRAWNDPRPFELTDLASKMQYSNIVQQAVDILKSIDAPDSKRALKDPRLCLTFPVWMEACERLSEKPRVILVIRSPIACGVSLVRRDGANLQNAVLLWARYFLGAVRNSKDIPTALVRYDDFVNNPDDCMNQALEDLEFSALPENAGSLRDLLRVGASADDQLAGNLPTALEKITTSLFDAAQSGLADLRSAAVDADQMLAEAYSIYGNIIDTHFNQRYHQLRTRELMKPQIELLQTRAEIAEARLRALRAEKELRVFENPVDEK